MKFSHPLKQQQGVSLVELMVVLVISSFLIIGVTQIYVDNKRNYLAQQSMGDIQEGSRFALRSIEQQLLKSGYKTLPQDTLEMAFPFQSAGNGCPQFLAGQVIAPTTSGRGICFRYQRRTPSEVDCLGATISTTAAITTRIELDTTKNELQCAAQGAAAQAVVSDVANISFTFGVDLNSDRLADTYIASPAAGSIIVASRISLLQRSDNATVALAPQAYYFPLSTTVTTTATDNRLYKSAQSTVALRNIAQ